MTALTRLLDVTASLRAAQRCFDEAFKCLDEAIKIYKRLGDRHQLGRELICKGIYMGQAGEAEAGINLLEAGLTMIDREREPKLVISAIQGLAHRYIELERFREARVLMFQNLAFYREHGSRMIEIRRCWLEGKIAAGLKNPEQAEKAFQKVRAALDQEGQSYVRALVTLDLAKLWAEQGKKAAVFELVEEMVFAFSSMGIEREAFAAILVLREAAEREDKLLELLQSVSDFLKRLEHGRPRPAEPNTIERPAGT